MLWPFSGWSSPAVFLRRVECNVKRVTLCDSASLYFAFVAQDSIWKACGGWKTRIYLEQFVQWLFLSCGKMHMYFNTAVPGAHALIIIRCLECAIHSFLWPLAKLSKTNDTQNTGLSRHHNAIHSSDASFKAYCFQKGSRLVDQMMEPTATEVCHVYFPPDEEPKQGGSSPPMCILPSF